MLQPFPKVFRNRRNNKIPWNIDFSRSSRLGQDPKFFQKSNLMAPLSAITNGIIRIKHKESQPSTEVLLSSEESSWPLDCSSPLLSNTREEVCQNCETTFSTGHQSDHDVALDAVPEVYIKKPGVCSCGCEKWGTLCRFREPDFMRNSVRKYWPIGQLWPA